MGPDLSDIQGNVLLGFGYPHARHFALAVGNADGGRNLIAGLLPSEENTGAEITPAEWWGDEKHHKPSHCLNIGITHQGLRALGVPDAVLATFPTAFQQGSAARSSAPDPDQDIALGDIGPSAPANWVLGGDSTPGLPHILLSLYARSDKRLEEVSRDMRAQFATYGVAEVSHHDADALPEGRVHFGYRDGIAQPRVDGAPGRWFDDMQPDTPTGDFLLGCDYTNTYRGNFIGDVPGALGNNATYGAFRIQGQDVHGFEELLDYAVQAAGMNRELVAAKLMGRWRNGVPLTLSPETNEPNPPLKRSQINAFDYAPGSGHPAFYDDAEGLRCPIGAHVRRLNPRGSMAMGIPNSRRIIRRSMPYGPEIEPGAPPDDIERGLIGYFFCGDLEMQFEFIQRVWINEDISTHGLRGTREPFVGAQPRGGGRFTIRTADARDPIALTGLPNLVTTRGSAYCMLPGIGGLRYLASLNGTPA